MDLSQLNEIASDSDSGKKKWTDLEKGKQYLITEINKLDTRYGKRMVLTFEEGFQIFLPGRVSALLYKYEDQYNYLIAKANKLDLFILYLGKSEFKFV